MTPKFFSYIVGDSLNSYESFLVAGKQKNYLKGIFILKMFTGGTVGATWQLLPFFFLVDIWAY